MNHDTIAPKRSFAAVALLVIWFLGFLAAGDLQAGTINVTTTLNTVDVQAPDGFCSFRECINAANAGTATSDCPGATAGSNTCVLSAGEYYDLQTVDHVESSDGSSDCTPKIITNALVIQGNGATLQGDGDDISCRALHSSSTAPLTIENLNIDNFDVTGSFAEPAFGGGILSEAALVVTDSTIKSCEANFGGGVMALGDLTMTDSFLQLNVASVNAGGEGGYGGAGVIRGTGDATITDTLFYVNVGAIAGGALGIATSGTVQISKCGLYSNFLFSADTDLCIGGAAVFDAVDVATTDIPGGPIGIDQSTISANTNCDNSVSGGAITANGSEVTVTHSTIVDNDGGGIASYGSGVHIQNTIVAGNSDDLVGLFISDGNNIIGDVRGALYDDGEGDQLGPVLCDSGASIMLDPGVTFVAAEPIPYYVPVAGSIAEDAGNCETGYTDLLGNAVVGSACEIGTTELLTPSSSISPLAVAALDACSTLTAEEEGTGGETGSEGGDTPPADPGSQLDQAHGGGCSLVP